MREDAVLAERIRHLDGAADENYRSPGIHADLHHPRQLRSGAKKTT
jgi:hypothetical protein